MRLFYWLHVALIVLNIALSLSLVIGCDHFCFCWLVPSVVGDTLPGLDHPWKSEKVRKDWHSIAAAPHGVASYGVWRVACGVWLVACGLWRVACGVLRVA
jgi:hypothetical protein